MNNDTLTDKQQIFCKEYVIDWNATRAAIAAGYSKKTARQAGSRLLTDVNIAAYIEECRQKTAELAGISALRVAKEYEKIAFASVAALRIDWSTVRDWDDLTDDQKSVISEIEVTVRTVKTPGKNEDEDVMIDTKVKVRLYDKVKALDALRAMFGFDEAVKIDHQSKGQQIGLFPGFAALRGEIFGSDDSE